MAPPSGRGGQQPEVPHFPFSRVAPPNSCVLKNRNPPPQASKTRLAGLNAENVSRFSFMTAPPPPSPPPSITDNSPPSAQTSLPSNALAERPRGAGTRRALGFHSNYARVRACARLLAKKKKKNQVRACVTVRAFGVLRVLQHLNQQLPGFFFFFFYFGFLSHVVLLQCFPSTVPPKYPVCSLLRMFSAR